MKAHWTETSIKDYLFSIAFDFVSQLEEKMKSENMNQDDLASVLGLTKGRISQIFNKPGNLTIKKIIQYSRALKMKVSIVAYDDGDPDNKKGPINADIFKSCWETYGKPRDFWAFQENAEKTASNITNAETVTVKTLQTQSNFLCLLDQVPQGSIIIKGELENLDIYRSVDDKCFANFDYIYDPEIDFNQKTINL